MQPSKAFQRRAAKSADIFSVNELKILTDGWKTTTHWRSDKLSTDENQRKTLGEQFRHEWQTQTDLLCRPMMTRKIISQETIGCWLSNHSTGTQGVNVPCQAISLRLKVEVGQGHLCCPLSQLLCQRRERRTASWCPVPAAYTMKWHTEGGLASGVLFKQARNTHRCQIAG